MKYFKIISAITMIILVLGISGCAGKSNDTQNAANGERRGPDGDFKIPDASGEIIEITGNEIKLKEIKMNMRTPNPDEEQNPEERRNRMVQRKEGGEPENFDPDNMPTQQPVEYTGETLEIIIPTGLKITQMVMSEEEGEPTTKEVNISELKKGDTLSITYASDGKTVASVSLSGGQMFFRRGVSGGARPEGGSEGSVIYHNP